MYPFGILASKDDFVFGGVRRICLLAPNKCLKCSLPTGPLNLKFNEGISFKLLIEDMLNRYLFGRNQAFPVPFYFYVLDLTEGVKLNTVSYLLLLYFRFNRSPGSTFFSIPLYFSSKLASGNEGSRRNGNLV